MTEKKSGPTTDVIQDAIRPYAIAEKLRQLRLRKSMGLTQLAAHTGLSPAMLSKLENGRLVPTLPTLIRIATVFDVGLDYFFTNERKRHAVAIVRRTERSRPLRHQIRLLLGRGLFMRHAGTFPEVSVR